VKKLLSVLVASIMPPTAACGGSFEVGPAASATVTATVTVTADSEPEPSTDAEDAAGLKLEDKYEVPDLTIQVLEYEADVRGSGAEAGMRWEAVLR